MFSGSSKCFCFVCLSFCVFPFGGNVKHLELKQHTSYLSWCTPASHRAPIVPPMVVIAAGPSDPWHPAFWLVASQEAERAGAGHLRGRGAQRRGAAASGRSAWRVTKAQGGNTEVAQDPKRSSLLAFETGESRPIFLQSKWGFSWTSLAFSLKPGKGVSTRLNCTNWEDCLSAPACLWRRILHRVVVTQPAGKEVLNRQCGIDWTSTSPTCGGKPVPVSEVQPALSGPIFR